MRQVGALLGERGVAAIYLVHGTPLGPDALDLLTRLQRFFPEAARRLRPAVIQLADHWTGDVGNYTESYAHHFEQGINRRGDCSIPVRLFHWSNENHHLGRADGAVRLIDELASLDLKPGERVLLWGHGHAGNVFALATNLLSGNQEAIQRFFRAAEIYYRWPILGCVDIPVWSRVHSLLVKRRCPIADIPLDIVTFGTPVCYGWDSAGYSRLLHFINRRVLRGSVEPRASFPLKLEDVLAAAEGDYVQQLAIAGTNVRPSLFSWRAWLADRRLERLLDPDTPQENPLDRFRAGTILPDEGTTLLVDYGEAEGSLSEHHAGHAVYTRKQWLLFHAEEVARRFYEAEARQVA